MDKKRELRRINQEIANGKYNDVLSHLRQPTAEWESKAPRLTEDQKRQLQRITRGIYYKYMKEAINRRTFNKLHERMEEELYDKIRSQMGLKATLEWRVIFEKSAIQAFASMGMPHPAYVDGVLPTTDFIESDLFDYIEVFEPVVNVDQFDDYSKFMDSTEASIKQAEKRREQGDAYFTPLDKQINFRPDVGTGDALED